MIINGFIQRMAITSSWLCLITILAKIVGYKVYYYFSVLLAFSFINLSLWYFFWFLKSQNLPWKRRSTILDFLFYPFILLFKFVFSKNTLALLFLMGILGSYSKTYPKVHSTIIIFVSMIIWSVYLKVTKSDERISFLVSLAFVAATWLFYVLGNKIFAEKSATWLLFLLLAACLQILVEKR